VTLSNADQLMLSLAIGKSGGVDWIERTS
jgi:hypothetical protein